MVFVDTSAFLAIKNRRDARHRDAVRLKEHLLVAGKSLLTTDYVLDETYTIIRLRAGHRVAVEFGEELRVSRLIRIEYVTAERIERAWDCSSVFRTHGLHQLCDHAGTWPSRCPGVRRSFPPGRFR